MSVEGGDDVFEFFGDAVETFVENVAGNLSVVCGGNASGYGGHGVGVASEGYGFADGRFVVGAFKKAYYCFGHGALAAYVEAVGGEECAVGATEVVAECGFDAVFNLLFCFAYECQVYGQGCGLCAFDAFGVVVGDGGGLLCQVEHLFAGFAEGSHGAYAHGRAVAPAIVWRRVVREYPFAKTSAIACAGIFAAPVLESFIEGEALDEGVGDGYGTHCVVGEAAC